MKIFFTVITLFICLSVMPQSSNDQEVSGTFSTTRVINAHSSETLAKRTLDIRIVHRFGDIAGSNGGHESFYGLDNATDIRIALEYGILDDLMVGIGRSKGFQLKQLFDGFVKYKILKQRADNKIPFTLTLFANAAVSTMKASLDETSVTSFPKKSHRWTYTVQGILARKFGSRFSIEVLPTMVHRNYVPFGDENTLFALGAAARIKVAKQYAIIIDYFHPFSDFRKQEDPVTGEKRFFDPLGIGLEIETGGHIFHLNFTNSTGIIANEFIPYTRRNWWDGQFRLGFNISRKFKL